MPERSHALFEETVGQRYVLLDQLGEGPVGSIYQARDETGGQLVAVKLAAPRLSVSPRVQAAWRESAARTAGPLPNTAEVLDWGFCPELLRPYVVTRFIEGRSLNQLMTGEAFPTAEAMPVLEQIARSLHAAHTSGLAHGDLKPANVMIAEEGADGEQVIVRDYELTLALERVSDLHAPLDFRAPELRGTTRDATAQSDLFSLGVIALRLLTGNDPRSLDPKGPLTPILIRMLQERPENRPKNAGEVGTWISALGGYLGGAGPTPPAIDSEGMEGTMALGIPTVKPKRTRTKARSKAPAAMFGQRAAAGFGQGEEADIWRVGPGAGAGESDDPDEVLAESVDVSFESVEVPMDSVDIQPLGSVDLHPADQGGDAAVAATMALAPSPEFMSRLRAAASAGEATIPPQGTLHPDEETGEIQVPENLLGQVELMEPTLNLELPAQFQAALLAEEPPLSSTGKQPTGRQPKWMPTDQSPGVARKKGETLTDVPLDAVEGAPAASAAKSRRNLLVAGGVTLIAVVGGLLAFFLR